MPAIVIKITAFMLFLGALPLPYYPYYPILRIVVTVVFIWSAYVSSSRKRSDLSWLFCVGAILFNPIFIIELPKLLWSIIDIGCGIFFLVNLKRLQEHSNDELVTKENDGSQGLAEKYDEEWLGDEKIEGITEELDNEVEVVETSKNELMEKGNQAILNHPPTTFSENLLEPQLRKVLFSRKVKGEFKWFKEGDEDNDIKYEGEIKNGEPNGQGTLTRPTGEKYVGDWKNGEFHGQGTFTFSNGEKYIGEFKDGNCHGQGTKTSSTGDKCVGDWKNGKLHGQGTYTWSDGDMYVGEFKDGKFHGQGTLTLFDGEKYEGEFMEGKKHGQGTVTYTEGEKYEGEWKNGKVFGAVTYIYEDGSKYKGERKDGKFHGVGKLTLPDGDVFEGGFKDGKSHGLGTYISTDGTRYTGRWKDGEFHGKGSLTSKNVKYEGEWEEGKKHGHGTLTLPNGETFVGKFKQDKPWKGKQYDKFGEFIGKIVAGVEK